MEIISIEFISENVFNLSEQTEVFNIKRVLDDIPKGKTVVLVEGLNSGLSIDAFKVKECAISEPPTSSVMKGSVSGFVENLKTNLSSIK